VLLRSGLFVQRDEGPPIDRFRNRLMIPIHRDNGAIVAFGGRAMDAGQQPKYLNSPETPIYTKGRTLYGLHLSKDVHLEGAAGRDGGRLLRLRAGLAGRHHERGGVVRYRADARPGEAAQAVRPDRRALFRPRCRRPGGRGALVRTAGGRGVPGQRGHAARGDDPDNFIRKQGAAAYQEKLRTSRPYLEYLLDRAAAAYDFTKDDDRRAFLTEMLGVAARIPDAAARDQFADRLAHRARITEEVVRAEIRKAAVAKRTTVEERTVPAASQVKSAEKGLIWSLVHTPAEGLEALARARRRGPRRARGAGDPAAGPIPAGVAGRDFTENAAGASKPGGSPAGREHRGSVAAARDRTGRLPDGHPA
jgi:DNA primase